jgi:glyoxylase-like metal-dependent hydrolase (beta-lactamase superfamily II)
MAFAAYNRQHRVAADEFGANDQHERPMTDSRQLEQGWFDVRQPEPGVFVIEEPLHVERVKSYLVVGGDRAVLIDTGMGVGDMRALVDGLTDRNVTVVNSHAHWDHIGGNHQFDQIAIHAAEAPALQRGVGNAKLRASFAPDRLRGSLPPTFDPTTAAFPARYATSILDGGERFELGGRTLDVIHTPGHSPGGIVLLDREGGALFSTDVAYAGALYCQFPDSDLEAYRRSLRALAELAPTLRVVYPAHGESPIEPSLLPRMADALDAIAAGRPADAIQGDVAWHEFDRFSVLVAAGPSVAEGA